MTPAPPSSEAPAPTRRSRRRGTIPQARALSWMSDDDFVTGPTPTPPVDDPSDAHDLLGERPRRSPWRPGVLVPLGVVVALVVAYCTTMLAWQPAASVTAVSRVAVHAPAAPAASVTWPATGSAGVSVTGMGAPLASTTQQSSIASITKLVTIMLVLEHHPLKVGQAGPSYAFTWNDQSTYWQYTARNESALPVPVDGKLSLYQMLEGSLLASASNYVQRLADEIWPSDAEFSREAATWLSDNGIRGITIVNPTGFNEADTATPAALLQLSQKALRNPVVAEIVAKKTATLPGAGTIHNTNALLADKGVNGVKTGSLVGYDVVASKKVTVAGTPVQIGVVTLNQPTSDERWKTARDLFAQVSKQLAAKPVVPAGTTVATFTTPWGAKAEAVTDASADLVLWNKAAPKVAAPVRAVPAAAAGTRVGTLTATGPVNRATVPIVLKGDLAGPDGWWRLTHPFALLGLHPLKGLLG